METLDMVAAFKADKGPNSNPNQEKIDEIVSKLENEILIYRKKLTSGEYNGEGEEPTVEQKEHRTKIEKMLRKAQALKDGEKIKEGEYTFEQYRAELHPFMLETYKDKWGYGKKQINMVEKVVSSPDNVHIDETIPFDEMIAVNLDDAKLEANKSKAGELYLTSESVDFETAKLFTPEIPEKISINGVGAVMKYIKETYKETHILPDLKYYQYILQLGDRKVAEQDPVKKKALLDQIPEQLRGEDHHYFPGSLFVDAEGGWVSPNLRWNSVGFVRNADRIENRWYSNYQVVLFER